MILSAANFKKALNFTDWKLLLFLILFLDVKLAVKIAAIVLIYLLRFDFRFKFSWKNTRLPLFYLVITGIAFTNLIFTKSYQRPNYAIVFITGIGFWLLCLLAIHQVKLAVEKNQTATIHHTLMVFFVLNAILSFLNIATIIWQTGAINPYLYQGDHQKYFVGTGDYIKGLTFDVSTTNAVINALGMLYFLFKKKYGLVLLCMAVLLLTASNFVNITLLLILSFLFCFNSNRDQKSMMVVCLTLLVIFLAKISPQNAKYVNETLENSLGVRKSAAVFAARAKPQTTVVTTEETKRQFARRYLDSLSAAQSPKIRKSINPALIGVPRTSEGRISILKPDINTEPYQSQTAITPEQQQLVAFIKANRGKLPISGKDTVIYTPGKIIALKQTFNFFKQHPTKILAGDGMGNFSSKLAFRATAFGFAGGFPLKYRYISQEFLMNHFDLYLNFFSKKSSFHSLTNSPNSVYDQLLTEYGLLGLFSLLVFYFGFFLKHHNILTYGLPMLFLMGALFLVEYCFEQLSAIVVMELFMFLDIKENKPILKPVNIKY